MNKQTSTQLLDELARESLGQDINLSSDLMIKVRKEKNKTMKKRTLITTFAALVVVVAILASVPSVAQAIKQLFGYIPGAGFVEDNVPLRSLEEPVEYKHKVAKITITQVVVDSKQTHLTYQVENNAFPETKYSSSVDQCHKTPWLQFSDGRQLKAETINGNFWNSGYSRELDFENIPVEDQSASLVLPCIEGALTSTVPQPIEIPFTLIEAPEGLTVYPLVKLPTPTLQTSTTEVNSPVDTFSLSVTKYIQTDEQLLLMGTLTKNSTDFWFESVDESDVHLLDGAGNAIVITEDRTVADPDTESDQDVYPFMYPYTYHADQETVPDAEVYPFTYRTAGRYIPGKGSLIFDTVWVQKGADQSYTFDPTTSDQFGQTWSFEVDGHTITIKDETTNLQDTGRTYKVETPEEIGMILIGQIDHPQCHADGALIDGFGFINCARIPESPITLNVTAYTEKITGPWQAEVDLPAFTDGALPTPMPESCLTESTWKAALNNDSLKIPGSLLDGKLILASTLAPDYYYHVVSADLTGADPSDLDRGDGGSLSPDGKTLVYATNGGLKLMNLETGENLLVADTTRRDRGPLWSPDGTKIAFTRGPGIGKINAPGPYELMLMDADGSNITTLLSNAEANTAQTWMPSGSTLIYSVKGQEGITVKSIEIISGEMTTLTQVNYQNARIAVSPDGKQISYEAMLPGDRYSVYISNLDGSNARLIANADPIVVTEPYWSPDGKWLMVSVQDTSLSEYMPTLALVNVESCQIIPITSLQGYVTSWR